METTRVHYIKKNLLCISAKLDSFFEQFSMELNKKKSIDFCLLFWFALEIQGNIFLYISVETTVHSFTVHELCFKPGIIILFYTFRFFFNSICCFLGFNEHICSITSRSTKCALEFKRMLFSRPLKLTVVHDLSVNNNY